MMNDEELIKNATEYMTELLGDNAGGHDAAHCLRVYRNALMIADQEPACDRLVVSLAAILHDVDDHKIFHTENNANARAFLTEHNVSAAAADRICSVINAVSFSQNRGKKPDSPEGMIVQDADRLDALGAIGIARTFAYGGEHGRSIEDSVRHFYDKLLLIREQLCTDTARRIAEKRHDFLLSFIRELSEETGDSL